MPGSGRNRGNLRNTAEYFAIEKAQLNRAGTGIKGYGKREV